MRRTLGASQVTIGGLLKHLAYMEDLNFTRDLAGEPLPSPWAVMAAESRGEQVWRSAADDDAESLFSLWRRTVARSRTAAVAAARSGGADFLFDVRPGAACSFRRLLVDLIEEYARHTGHADLLRESIDGRVGEDPPGDRYTFVLPGRSRSSSKIRYARESDARRPLWPAAPVLLRKRPR